MVDAEVARMKLSIVETAIGDQRAEALSNLQLAHRHLEDGRMRLGKVIQALEGGVSILDHPEVQALIVEIRARE
jgi:hypothetical protein